MALAEAGETDLAYKAIATETYPSYGYMLNNSYTNATTIWAITKLTMKNDVMKMRLTKYTRTVVGLAMCSSGSKIVVQPSVVMT